MQSNISSKHVIRLTSKNANITYTSKIIKNVEHQQNSIDSIKVQIDKAYALLSYQETSSINQALQLFQEILASHAQNEEAMKGIGDAYLKLGCYNDAISYFEKLPKNANAMKSCGDAYFALKLYDLAITKLQLALDLGYTPVDIAYKTIGDSYYHNARYQDALASYSKVLYDPWAHKTSADIFANGLGGVQQDEKKAIECYERARSLGLDCDDVIKNLGVMYMRIGDHQSALSIFAKITHKDAESAKYSGDILLQQRKYQEAIERYSVASGLNSQYVEVYRELAYCFLQLGNEKDALESYQKILCFAQPGSPIYREANAHIIKMTTYAKDTL